MPFSLAPHSHLPIYKAVNIPPFFLLRRSPLFICKTWVERRNNNSDSSSNINSSSAVAWHSSKTGMPITKEVCAKRCLFACSGGKWRNICEFAMSSRRIRAAWRKLPSSIPCTSKYWELRYHSYTATKKLTEGIQKWTNLRHLYTPPLPTSLPLLVI